MIIDYEKTLHEYSHIITDSIQTKTLQVGNATIDENGIIKTPRHDIGYHFELDDDDEIFEEGNILQTQKKFE